MNILKPDKNIQISSKLDQKNRHLYAELQIVLHACEE
jgi:hypothetical protein